MNSEAEQEPQAKLSHLVRMLNQVETLQEEKENKAREAEIANFAVSLDGVVVESYISAKNIRFSIKS